MKFIEGLLGDAVGWTSNFFLHTFMPWAWDNKMWFAVFIPIIALIAIAKWMWD